MSAYLMAADGADNKVIDVEKENAAAIKERLQKYYDKNYDKTDLKAETADMALMLSLTKSLDGMSDTDNSFTITTNNGNQMRVAEDEVSNTELFAKPPNDSDVNINGALEMALAAKGVMEDDAVVIGGTADPQQDAIMAYACQLAGLKTMNAPKDALDPAIKAKLDQSWGTMQKEMGLAPEQIPSVTIKPAEPEADQKPEEPKNKEPSNEMTTEHTLPKQDAPGLT